MGKQFISSSIIDTIVHYNANQHERESYATELNDCNFEKDLNVAIIGTSENYI